MLIMAQNLKPKDMRTKLNFILICAILFSSCYQEDETDLTLINAVKYKNANLDCILVAPSGDFSGVTDANNIENALNDAKEYGGIVCLTDGDNKTTDTFYTSRNIVVEGFNGELRGESMKKTIIYAGRKSESIGFSSAHTQWWAEFSANPLLPVVLQFDNPNGDVVVIDLTIILKDEQPTDIQNNYYGIPSTYMQSFIEILGGEHNTIIKNVRLEGRESLAFGTWRNMNVESGIHVMLGDPITFPNKTGNLTVKNVEMENIGGNAVLFMRFSQGSVINVDGVIAENVQGGIYAGGVFNSKVNLSNMDISINQNGWGRGIALWSIQSGLQIMHNTINGGKSQGIIFWGGVQNAVVFENKFINSENYIAAAILLANGTDGNSIYRNDYQDSNLPGWTSTSPNGPGAIFLNQTSNDNIIHEMKFPKNLSLCQMILDIGNNKIHNWQPCENLAKSGFEQSNFSKLEPEFNSNSRFHISKTD